MTITRLPHEQPIGISIRVEGVASLSKDAWDKIDTDVSNVKSGGANSVDSNNDVDPLATSCKTIPAETNNSDMSDDPEIIFTKIEKSKNIPANSESRKRKLGKCNVSTGESYMIFNMCMNYL